ncbi:MAG: CotH kinase family protein [Saccharofermentanales bacterium]|nr:CotH kinase family protein [Bacillota bacterium]NLB09016.1 hypothetical protein [Clostridiales bacterium]
MKKRAISILVITAVLIAVLMAESWGGGIKGRQIKGSYDDKPAPTAKIPGNLPIIMIETDGQRIEKTAKIWCDIKVIDNDAGKNTPESEPVFTSLATIKYRGNSSYYVFDKRQYRIEFYKDENRNRDYPLLGMTKNSSWILNAPFLDRSLIRNRLIYGLAREIMHWGPDTRYCEVYLDGEYQGVYLAIEPIRNDRGRLDMQRYGLLSGETAYLLRRERVGTKENPINSYGIAIGETNNEITVSYPAPINITAAQKKWIETDFNKFEKVLYSDYFRDPIIGYAAYIDVDNFVDYFLINELVMNIDGSHLSTYIYKDIGGKIRLAAWDFNNAFNNYPWKHYDTDRFFLDDTNWFDRLLQDRSFSEKVVERYRYLRQHEWTDARLNGLIDGYVEELGEAVERNFSIWGYTFNEKLLSRDDEGNIRDPRSYPQAVSMLKETLRARLKYLDENIDLLKDISQEFEPTPTPLNP